MVNLEPIPSPRRPTRQSEAGEVIRQQTRRRVLGAAAAEFAERGFTGATVARIAGRADVAVPTLYSAWGSKRALLRAVMAIAVTEQEDGFDGGADRNQLLGPAGPGRQVAPPPFLAHLATPHRLIQETSA